MIALRLPCRDSLDSLGLGQRVATGSIAIIYFRLGEFGRFRLRLQRFANGRGFFEGDT